MEMNTLKQITEENGKGIHSMFNACMHKAECCSKDDEIADLRSANAELMRQLGEWRNQAHQSQSAFERIGKQLAESQAREARLCGVLQIYRLEGLSSNWYAELGNVDELQNDDTALREYRDAVIEECAKECDVIAEKRWPNDIGPEAEMCSEAIRSRKGNTPT